MYTLLNRQLFSSIPFTRDHFRAWNPFPIPSTVLRAQITTQRRDVRSIFVTSFVTFFTPFSQKLFFVSSQHTYLSFRSGVVSLELSCTWSSFQQRQHFVLNWYSNVQVSKFCTRQEISLKTSEQFIYIMCNWLLQLVWGQVQCTELSLAWDWDHKTSDLIVWLFWLAFPLS